MKVDGRSLLITDPCYISKDDDWGESAGFDWDNRCINCPEFTDYEWENSGYGDGTEHVCQFKEKGQDLIKYIEDLKKARDDNDTKTEDDLMKLQGPELGQFCMDAGSWVIVYLDEALKYNPDFLKDTSKHCYCILKDFTGRINIYYDTDDYSHIIAEQEDKPTIFTT